MSDGSLAHPLAPDSDRDRFVIEAIGWVEHNFGIRSGLTAVGLYEHAIGPTTFRDPASDSAQILVTPGAMGDQLRYQLGHEAFHASWDTPVRHWSHEVAACLTALRLVERSAPTYARAALEHAVRHARGFSASDMRHFPSPHDRSNEEAFYGRALVVGIELQDVIGLAALGSLCRLVASSSCASHPKPGECEECGVDRAVSAWLTSLDTGSEVEVRTILLMNADSDDSA